MRKWKMKIRSLYQHPVSGFKVTTISCWDCSSEKEIVKFLVSGFKPVVFEEIIKCPEVSTRRTLDSQISMKHGSYVFDEET